MTLHDYHVQQAVEGCHRNKGDNSLAWYISLAQAAICCNKGRRDQIKQTDKGYNKNNPDDRLSQTVEAISLMAIEH